MNITGQAAAFPGSKMLDVPVVPHDPVAVAMFTAHRVDDSRRSLAHATERMAAARKAKPKVAAIHVAHVRNHLTQAINNGHQLVDSVNANYPAEAKELKALNSIIGMAKAAYPQAGINSFAHLVETILYHEAHGKRHADALATAPAGAGWEFDADHVDRHLEGALEHVGKLEDLIRDNYPAEAKWLAGLNKIEAAGSITAQVVDLSMWEGWRKERRGPGGEWTRAADAGQLHGTMVRGLDSNGQEVTGLYAHPGRVYQRHGGATPVTHVRPAGAAAVADGPHGKGPAIPGVLASVTAQAGLELASFHDHHIPGTPFNWRHGWIPLTQQAAMSHFRGHIPPTWHPSGTGGSTGGKGIVKPGPSKPEPKREPRPRAAPKPAAGAAWPPAKPPGTAKEAAVALGQAGKDAATAAVGAGNNAWNGKLTTYSGYAKPYQMAALNWNGSMEMRTDLAESLRQDALHPGDPVDNPRAYLTMLHELLHGSIPANESYRGHSDAYQEPHRASIEEGFNELGAVRHAPDWFDKIGVGGRETQILASESGYPVDNPEYIAKSKQLGQTLKKAAARLHGEGPQYNQAYNAVQSALTDLRYMDIGGLKADLGPWAHTGNPDEQREFNKTMAAAEALSKLHASRLATMSEYAKRLAEPGRVSTQDSWGHYGRQTAAAQAWVMQAAIAEGHHDINHVGEKGYDRVTALSDEINREGPRGKLTAMAKQAIRAAGADPADFYGQKLIHVEQAIQNKWPTGMDDRPQTKAQTAWAQAVSLAKTLAKPPARPKGRRRAAAA